MSLKIFFDNLKISFVGYSGAFLLWAIRKSLKLKILIAPEHSLDWSLDSPKVLAFWHGQQLMMPWIYLDHKPGTARKPISVLISKSKDGRFIAKAMDVLGIGSVAGSSSRGGKEALIQLVRLVKNGSHVAVTPDGPKGPARKVKVGALKISQLTGAEIIPACVAARPCWTFGSWDGMILPKPFSKAIIMTGKPILVPREATVAEVSEIAVKLEEELNRITEEAKGMLSDSLS